MFKIRAKLLISFFIIFLVKPCMGMFQLPSDVVVNHFIPYFTQPKKVLKNPHISNKSDIKCNFKLLDLPDDLIIYNFFPMFSIKELGRMSIAFSKSSLKDLFYKYMRNQNLKIKSSIESQSNFDNLISIMNWVAEINCSPRKICIDLFFNPSHFTVTKLLSIVIKPYSLRCLEIYMKSPITDSELIEICKHSPLLNELSFSSNKITEFGLEFLSKMNNLKIIILYRKLDYHGRIIECTIRSLKFLSMPTYNSLELEQTNLKNISNIFRKPVYEFNHELRSLVIVDPSVLLRLLPYFSNHLIQCEIFSHYY